MIEIPLPAMGEGIIEAEITRWLVREGDLVNIDDPLVEVATDKVDAEVASPASGILHKILLEEGDVPKVGQVLAMIRTEEEVDTGDEINAAGDSNQDTADEGTEAVPDKPAPEINDPIPNSTFQIPNSKLLFLSPQVKETIRKYQLTQSEVRSIQGTGKNGRITHRDLMEYISNRKTGQPEADQVKPVAEDPVISRERVYGGENNTVIEMDRMRRLIADHMVYSTKISPHVTSFVEIDVTNLVVWREQVKAAWQEKYNQKLTYTPMLIEAVVKAIEEFPGINVSLDGYKIIQKKQINIGMAVALPSGNLIVPVIREANKKNLTALAATVNDLAKRARENKLKPTDIQGGTFSITNLGQFGNISGTPIINQPEVAILAVGAIRKKPAVVETPDGDAIGIRNIVILSLSYDHRVVDGTLGGSFLKRIGDHLENADIDRKI